MALQVLRLGYCYDTMYYGTFPNSAIGTRNCKEGRARPPTEVAQPSAPTMLVRLWHVLECVT